jgi:acetyltransferase-like isoleucine patch superfamily enzyme
MRHAKLGSDCTVQEGAVLGQDGEEHDEPTVIGDGATIRRGTIVYANVHVGDNFTTGHNALVREHTHLGDDVLVGTDVTIDGKTWVGSDVSMQTGAYVPRKTTVEDGVFLGPHAVLTNDSYPLRTDDGLQGPVLRDGVSIGANATVLPGVTVGERSFVAAGAVVTDDVPPDRLAVGSPATHEPLPPALQGGNLQT